MNGVLLRRDIDIKSVGVLQKMLPLWCCASLLYGLFELLGRAGSDVSIGLRRSRSSTSTAFISRRQLKNTRAFPELMCVISGQFKRCDVTGCLSLWCWREKTPSWIHLRATISTRTRRLPHFSLSVSSSSCHLEEIWSGCSNLGTLVSDSLCLVVSFTVMKP